MDFNISNRHYVFKIFEYDCENEVTNALGATDTVTGLGNGFKQLDISFSIDPTEVENVASNIWTPTTNGGRIDFCVALSLYLADSEDHVVNFLETIYRVSIDNTAGFSVDDITTEKKETHSGGEIDIDYKAAIEGYQCDNNFNKVGSLPALRQADEMAIFIKAEQANSNFEVEKIFQFDVAQGQSNPTLEIISNKGDTNLFPQVTEVTYDYDGPTNIGKVKLQLLGMFFEDKNPGTLTVTGIVKLAPTNRCLQGSALHKAVTTARILSENCNDDNAAKFSLKVDLAVTSGTVGNIANVLQYAIVAVFGGVFILW